jgi:hypothetical protein
MAGLVPAIPTRMVPRRMAGTAPGHYGGLEASAELIRLLLDS